MLQYARVRTILLFLSATAAILTSVVVTAGARCASECLCTALVAHCHYGNLTFIPAPFSLALWRINLQHNTIFNLQNDSFRQLTALEEIDVQFNRISHIEANAFYGLGKLRVLLLRGNKINSLPEQVFTTNRDLQHLDLSQNAFYYIPQDSFLHLYNLQVLNLSYNYLSTASLGHNFQFTTMLHVLDLSHNNIPEIGSTDLSAISWWDVGRPHHLNLSHCGINHIERDAMEDLQPLTALSLAGNVLLPMATINNVLTSLPMTSLVDLNLSNMSITNIARFFQDSKFNRLVYLDLSQNFLQRLNSGLLSNLESLKTLDLSRNVLSVIQSLKGLNSIEVLDLSYNRLEDINFTFDGAETLRRLYLNHNRLIRLVDSPFESLFDLELLDVSHNAIESIEINIGFERLAVFDISHNNLGDVTFLPHLSRTQIINASSNNIRMLSANSFSRCASLECIHLSHNNIAQIEPTTFAKCERLRILDLSYNRLEQLANYGWLHGVSDPFSHSVTYITPMAFPLQEFHLHHNNISYVAPNCFQGLGALKTLDISYMGLYGFPANTFTDLVHLKSLNIAHNDGLGLFLSLPMASGVFQNLNQLEKLDASNCALTEFPQFLNSHALQSLRVIDLSTNQISALAESDLQALPILDMLNLAHNKLSTLDSHVIDRMASLEQGDFSHNPFQCSCDLSKLCDWLEKARAFLSDNRQQPGTIQTFVNGYYCTNDLGVQQNMLNQYCPLVIPNQCNDDIRLIFLIAIIAIVTIILLLGIFIVYKYCRRRKTAAKQTEGGDIRTMAEKNGGTKYEQEKIIYSGNKYITTDKLYKDEML